MAADDALIQIMRNSVDGWTVMQQQIFYNRGPLPVMCCNFCIISLTNMNRI